MKVLILGVGDAFTKRHFGSSALIAPTPAPGSPQSSHVLLDCGDLIHRALFEAAQKAGWRVDTPMIHDIIVTHLHGDHSNGLESLGFARIFQRKQDASLPIPRLYLNQHSAARVWEKLAPAMDGNWPGGTRRTLSDVFDVRVLDPKTPATVAGLAVRCRFTKHPVPTIGLLISDGRRTLGWSSDTPTDQEHIDWLSAADIIVHESNTGPVHTPIEALNAQPADLRRKMRLIHLRDDFDPRTTDIAILRQGDVIEL